MNFEPTIFIKEYREYDACDYPFLDAPDSMICRGKEMTYPEYVVARRLHPSKLEDPSPREMRKEAKPSFSNSRCMTWRKASLAPEKAAVPEAIHRKGTAPSREGSAW